MKERSLRMADGRLLATVCLPDGAPAPVAMVLFNAGIVHRVGPHRFNVRLARNLARAGIASIRLDLAGLGDSSRATDSYERQAVTDLRAAMDELGRAAGVGRFALFGFCSGGPHSYEVARADPRVAGIFLYDSHFYPTRRSRFNRYAASIRRKGVLRSGFGWLARMLAPRRAVQSSDRTPRRRATAAEFARGVHDLHGRGVKVMMVYSGGFPEAYNYDRQFHDVFGPLGITPFVGYRYLPHLDHTATIMASQRELIDVAGEWMRGLAAAGR